MPDTVKKHIQEMIDLETRSWNEKNPDLFLSMIHPDMVWPWPPTADAHDPVDWVFVLGRFDRERWRKNWQDIFDTHDLIRNSRDIVKIEVSNEQDAGFAVVDIDTVWRHQETKEDFQWKGRVCKIYTRMSTGEWKLISHTGALDYSKTERLKAGCATEPRTACSPGVVRSSKQGECHVGNVPTHMFLRD